MAGESEEEAGQIVTEVRRDRSGKMLEYSYRLEARRVPRRVLERRAHFERHGYGRKEFGTTMTSDEAVGIELVKRTKQQVEEEELASVSLSAREIKSETWTSRVGRLAQNSWADVVQSGDGADSSPGGPGGPGGAPAGGSLPFPRGGMRDSREGGEAALGGGLAPAGANSYVAPYMRGGGTRDFGGAREIGGPGGFRDRDRDRENEASLRVTNLPEDASEDELYDLFCKFGPLIRVFRGRRGNEFRNFAFVVFREHADADRAKEAMDGYGYRNLIMQVEYSKPRREFPDRSTEMN